MKEIHHAQAADLIAAERKRQKEEIGYTDETDDKHVRGELRAAAECYFNAALNEKGSDSLYSHPIDKVPATWPWSPGSWRPFSGKVRMLTKAGALYVAELERLKRKGKNDAHHLMLQETIEERIREVTEELNKALAPPTEERFHDHGKTFFNLRDLNLDGAGLLKIPEGERVTRHRPLNSIILTKEEHASLKQGDNIRAAGREFTVLCMEPAVSPFTYSLLDGISNFIYSESPEVSLDGPEVTYLYDYQYTVAYNNARRMLPPDHQSESE